MIAHRLHHRTWLAASACVSAGLILGGCPAQNNGNGQAATPQANNAQANVPGANTSTAAPPVDLAPPVPSSPLRTVNRNTQQTSRFRSTSPLYEAIAAKDPERVETALKAGADPNEFIQDGEYGAFTAMHTAARLGQPEIIRILVKYGGKVNIHAEAVHKATPLHWAARVNSVDAVQALIDAGADVNALAGVPGQPVTPLKVATDRSFHDVAVVIKAYGGKEPAELN